MFLSTHYSDSCRRKRKRMFFSEHTVYRLRPAAEARHTTTTSFSSHQHVALPSGSYPATSWLLSQKIRRNGTDGTAIE